MKETFENKEKYDLRRNLFPYRVCEIPQTLVLLISWIHFIFCFELIKANRSKSAGYVEIKKRFTLSTLLLRWFALSFSTTSSGRPLPFRAFYGRSGRADGVNHHCFNIYQKFHLCLLCLQKFPFLTRIKCLRLSSTSGHQ